MKGSTLKDEMPFLTSIHLSIYLYIHLSIYISIYLSIYWSIYLPNISYLANLLISVHFSVFLCVQYVWKEESASWELIIWKKIAQSPIINGPLSDRPERWHGNPPKADQARDDVGKNLANAIVAGFRRISSTGSDRFPSILGEFVDRASRQETMSIEFYVIQYGIFAAVVGPFMQVSISKDQFTFLSV